MAAGNTPPYVVIGGGQAGFWAADTLRKADAIYIDEIRKEGLYDKIWQAFSRTVEFTTQAAMPVRLDTETRP